MGQCFSTGYSTQQEVAEPQSLQNLAIQQAVAEPQVLQKPLRFSKGGIISCNGTKYSVTIGGQPSIGQDASATVNKLSGTRDVKVTVKQMKAAEFLAQVAGVIGT